MKHASVRFYGELNDLLPALRRYRPFAHPFDGRPSIKDLIESLGVPHTEVDLILVGGQPVDFTYQVDEGDRIRVYPSFRSIDVASFGRLQPGLPADVRFVADTHLGRLAAYLRLAGFDTLYRNDFRDDEAAELSQREDRILLTRDVGLLKRSIVTYGYYVRATSPRRQFVEILRRFDLTTRVDPFCRCLRCNLRLEPVSKEAVVDRLPPRTREHFEEFSQCPGCGRVYWAGSHYGRMEHWLGRSLAEARSPDESRGMD